MVMELRLAVIFGLCCIASLQVVEGSGGFPGVAGRKKPEVGNVDLVSSGASPDDEDGDVDDGSGSPSDEFEGSGALYPSKNLSSPSAVATTTVIPDDVLNNLNRRPDEEYGPGRPVDEPGHHYGQSLPDEDADLGPKHHEDHDILIESSSTARATPPSKSSPSVPASTTSPKVFEDDRNARLGALFKPGILAAVIGGFVVGILAAILLVMFIVYRMRKKDEGSYALDEQKQPPIYPYAYQKAPTKEFYA